MVLINKKPVTLSFKTVSLALAAVSSVVLTLVALAWLLGLPLPGFVAMTSSAAGAAGASAGRPRFLLFGDSLTERGWSADGWVAALADTYGRRIDVLNRGLGGYNTRWVQHILGDVFNKGDCAGVQLVTIFFGANDAARPDAGSGKQNIPLDEYSANLKKIIEHVKRATGGGAAILLITPPPVYADGRVLYQKQRMRENGANLDGVAVVPDRTNDYTQRYAQACCAVAEESSLPCVDLWTGLQAADPSNWGPAFFTDGLHFSHAGERAVARLVLQGIADKLPHLRPERMKLQFPHWADIDVAALEESFERHKAQRLQQS